MCDKFIVERYGLYLLQSNMNNEHGKKLFIVITIPNVKGTNWD